MREASYKVTGQLFVSFTDVCGADLIQGKLHLICIAKLERAVVYLNGAKSAVICQGSNEGAHFRDCTRIQFGNGIRESFVVVVHASHEQMLRVIQRSFYNRRLMKCELPTWRLLELKPKRPSGSSCDQ